MDSDYLKETVGPILSEAIGNLVLYGLSQNRDPIVYVANYMLHHKATQRVIKEDLDKEKEIHDMFAQYEKKVENFNIIKKQNFEELKLATQKRLQKVELDLQREKEELENEKLKKAKEEQEQHELQEQQEQQEEGQGEGNATENGTEKQAMKEEEEEDDDDDDEEEEEEE